MVTHSKVLAFCKSLLLYCLFCALLLFLIQSNQSQNLLRYERVEIYSGERHRLTEDEANKEIEFGPNDTLVNLDKLMIINKTCPYDLLGRPLSVQRNCPKDDLTNPCHNLTCQNILTFGVTGGEEFYQMAKNFTLKYDHNDGRLSDVEFTNLTRNCSEFMRVRGFDKKLSWHGDSDFPIAYNILAHSSAEQIERLVYALFRPHNQICIHADFKPYRPTFEPALRGIISCLPDNVFLASKLEKIVYAGFTRLQADITCMADHLKTGKDWKYLINTAGQAFPLRSNREMVKILKLYRGTNDVEGIYGRHAAHIRTFWLSEFAEHNDGRGTVRTGRTNPPPPHDIDIAKGSAYGAFSRPFVEFMINDKRAKDLLEWMRPTWSPDELYWATLSHRYVNPHLKAPGGYRGFPRQDHWLAVYVNWVIEECQGTRGHGSCVFGVGDLPSLVRQPHLFANKWWPGYQTLGLECIRAWIEHKELCPVEYDYEIYKRLPRVRELLRTWVKD